MLFEPFPMRNAEPPSNRRRLAIQSAYDFAATTLWRSGSYTSSCFHIDSTIAAIRRATVSESFFSTVKSELGDRFDDYGQAKMELFDYIEML
jgi:hypothetical protein